MTKKQRANAERIVKLADTFGHLPYNKHGQTVEGTLNLSIPTARLIKAGVVTGVADTCDGVNDDAVAEVEEHCRIAVEFNTARHGAGWWNESAAAVLVPGGDARPHCVGRERT